MRKLNQGQVVGLVGMGAALLWWLKINRDERNAAAIRAAEYAATERRLRQQFGL